MHIHLTNPQVRQALQHPLLAHKKPIASGTFSRVFNSGNPNTILKLTTDIAHLEFLTHPLKPTNEHAPLLISNYGQIGSITSQPNTPPTPLFLLEMERLEPIPRSHPHYTTATKILRSYHRHLLASQDPDQLHIPSSIWSHPTVPTSIQTFFDQLLTLTSYLSPPFAIDTKAGYNLLWRQHSNTLVFADILFTTNHTTPTEN